VARIKGEPDNKTSKDKLGDEFEALLADAINNKHDRVMTGYFTTIKSLLISPAILISTINALIDDLTFYSLLY
jgi:hypothetical protein